MGIFRNLFRGKSEPKGKSELIQRAEAFARQAVRTKSSVSVRFLELPVFITAIFREYGPPSPKTAHLMLDVPERLSFTCPKCGQLDTGWIMKYYQPPYPDEKKRCPNCRGSDTVEITYDPSRRAKLP